jgi:O-antigen/teichoic acid export membrane protein
LSVVETVTDKAKRSVKWSVLNELVSRTIQPVIFLVLARLLTPDDFGLASAATIVINFSQMLWDAGLGKALIQTKEDLEQAADVVFWVNAALGVTIYAILFTTAPLIAIFFHSPSFVPVLRVVGLQVVILSLSSVQQALLVRDMGFQKLFKVKLATALVPGLFSIPMAVAGLGVWALVAGTLVGSALYMVLLWQRSTWRPKWSFNLSLVKRLFNFGIWVVGEGLIGWFIVWGDNLVVGRSLGTQDLGVYAVAWNICNIIYGLLLNPFLPVLYSAFSRLQDDRDALKAAFQRANSIVMAIALPVGVGLLLVAPQFVTVFFGEKWQGLGMVLRLIGFMFGMAWVVGINPEVYRSIGRPDVNTKLALICLAYYLPAYIIAAQFNLVVFSYVRLGVALVSLPIHSYMAMRLLGLSPFYLWQRGKAIILAAIGMAVAGFGSAYILPSTWPAWAQLLALVPICVAVYGIVLWLLDHSFILQTVKLFRNAAFNR